MTLPALAVLAGCLTEVEPESPANEYAWSGSYSTSSRDVLEEIAADTPDSVIYLVFTEIDESGRADGILTVMNDSTRWRYDPYHGLVGGFMTRDSLDAPVHMLAELTREHDGAACRMAGPVDSLGRWSSELTCGGSVVDSVQLLPTRHGFITGRVTSHSARGPDEGVRVSYCPYDDGGFTLSACKAAGYTATGGRFRLRVPPGDWFVTYSIWDPIFDEWEYCRTELGSESYSGRFVTVRLAQASDASAHCPWFN
ncbi:MAG: hypothetical protein OXI76_11185 [Gemmatimonadota bacterium]|nr:hypothetical protein [Gemmatimonadota bacterium]